MTPEERFKKFEEIKSHYQALDTERLRQGKFAMGETSHGFWGTTNMNDAWLLFTRIKLERFAKFVDLGCGDGRIVAIASLFTDATGIEGDEGLVNTGKAAQDALSVDMEVKAGNYYDEDLSGYDLLFMFPDKEYDETILTKLRNEVRGHLMIYNNIYLPKGFPKGKTLWIEQLPVATYPLNIDENQPQPF